MVPQERMRSLQVRMKLGRREHPVSAEARAGVTTDVQTQASCTDLLPARRHCLRLDMGPLKISKLKWITRVALTQ